jgi:hypothetical protein
MYFLSPETFRVCCSWSFTKLTHQLGLFHPILKLFEGSGGKHAQDEGSRPFHVLLEEMMIGHQAGISRKTRISRFNCYTYQLIFYSMIPLEEVFLMVFCPRDFPMSILLSELFPLSCTRPLTPGTRVGVNLNYNKSNWRTDNLDST